MSDWPFTPEVDTGGWQVAEHHGRYWLDEDYHERNEEQESANVSLIAAAPRMYRALKAILGAKYESDRGFAFDDAREIIDWIDQR